MLNRGTNLEKFDVNRALAGEPVRLRNGLKAFVTHKLNVDLISTSQEIEPYELVGFTVQNGKFNGVICWTLSGNFYQHVEGTEFDIVEMWNDNIIKVDLPRPLKTAERNQHVYFITAKGISSVVYKETANDLLMLEDARFFATREDAKAWEDLAKRVRDM
ncbi:hypothetical protein [Pasteurella multocida]|uniref:hypothetical protein n=1 Tax=Pasteurella multocida TaxID=747 RepID=UPI00021450AD|nr:hypothetical protein AAUPMG_11801 [Pasteurella multocida subsp. multocida str. Anand1_goat]